MKPKALMCVLQVVAAMFASTAAGDLGHAFDVLKSPDNATLTFKVMALAHPPVTGFEPSVSVLETSEKSE